MIIARVIGNMVSTIKHEAYHATKLMIVQPVGLDLRAKGEPMIAVDTVGAGEGETVLLIQEGQSAKEILGVEAAPVRALIVGIVDHADIDVKRET